MSRRRGDQFVRQAFSTPKYKGTGAVTFCVTNVTGPNDSFDATNACRTN